MKEITRVIYVADDGREFTDKQTCWEYESEIKELKNLKRTLKRLRDYCNKRGGCVGCPFLYGDCCGITFQNVQEGTAETPYNWKVERWGEG